MGNTGNTYTMTRFNGRNSGPHYSDEELLAFLEQDGQGDERWRVMKQHVSTCTPCSRQVSELEQTITLLKQAYFSNTYDFYPSITNDVMWQTHEPKSTVVQRLSGQRSREGRKRTALLPVAAMLVGSCIFVLGLILLAPLMPTNGHHPKTQVTPIVAPTATLHVVQHATPKPTSVPATTVPTESASPPTQGGGIAYSNCTNGLDEANHRLRICGSGLIPGDKFALTLVDKRNNIMKRVNGVQVQADGTFSQNISIHSCKDVPWAIYIQDVSLPGEQVTTLSSISYGNC